MKHGAREGWTNDGDLLFLVRPIRERCRYYKRQVFSNDEEQDETKFGHRIIFRNCTMRKSVGGAFMSLRDEAVYACDYRSPAAPESVVRYLDEPDGRQLRSRAHLKMVALFGLGAEPETYQPPALPVVEEAPVVTNGEAAKGESP